MESYISLDEQDDGPSADARPSDAPLPALERVRAMIASGALRAGGRLPPERELSETLGVSRRALRHVLGILEAEGRIVRHHGRGTFVADVRLATENLVQDLPRLTNPLDTIEARLAIEPQQARLAALRATPGDIDRLFEAAEASRTAPDLGAYRRADAAFHRRVAVAARNPLLISIFDAVMEAALEDRRRQRHAAPHCIDNQTIYAADHRRIAAAIAERNPAQAEAVMRAHLNGVQQRRLSHAFPPPAEAAE